MAIEDNLYDWIIEARRRGSAKGMPPKPAPNPFPQSKVPIPAVQEPERPSSRTVRQARQAPEGKGPGTELKKLLARFGIRAGRNCWCNARAAEMDRRGPKWCRENLDTIVAWLEDEAARRKLRFYRFGASLLVRLAIRRAQREVASDRQGSRDISADGLR